MSRGKGVAQLLDLHDPNLEAPTREALCRWFHERLYRAAFPKRHHAEGQDQWLPLLVSGVRPAAPDLHILLALRRRAKPEEIRPEDLLGGIAFEFFRASRCGLVTYIVVAEHARRRGVGRVLLRRALDTLADLAGSSSMLVFAETEDPRRLAGDGPTAHAEASERLAALDALGFQELPVAYRQPPLSPGTGWADDLLLMVYAPEGDRPVPRRALRAFLDEFEQSLAHNLAGRQPEPHDPFAGLPSGSAPVTSVPLTQRLPYANRPRLGRAAAVAVRFTFFSDPADFN